MIFELFVEKLMKFLTYITSVISDHANRLQINAYKIMRNIETSNKTSNVSSEMMKFEIMTVSLRVT